MHIFSLVMEIKGNEKILMKYLNEFREKPSKVSAELFYYSRTTATWQAFESVLFNWLDIYSELGSSEYTNFNELCLLATNVQPVDELHNAETCRVFNDLRTHNRDFIESDKEAVMKMLAINPSPKGLLCQTFISLMEDNVIDIYKYFALALGENVIDVTRSILSSFSKKDLNLLKNKFIEGHTRSVYACSCNPNKVTQHLRRMVVRMNINWLIGGRLTSCKVLDVIAELESLLKMLSSCKADLSPIHELHLNAQRYDLARHFYMEFKGNIRTPPPQSEVSKVLPVDGEVQADPPPN